MTDSAQLNQTDLQCAQCGGQCRFAPKLGALLCQSCGTAHPVVDDLSFDPETEISFDPDTPRLDVRKTPETAALQCGSCGGAVVFHGQSISENCPYCDGALVRTVADESYDALGMIPFAVDAVQAQTKALDWVARRWVAPSNLGEHVAGSRVAGIYVPFWTFDSVEAVDYTILYRVNSGKSTSTRTQRGSMSTKFDDMLVPASGHVTPLIRDGILHDFDPEKLRPVNAGYLAGFAAERHHQSVEEGLDLKADDKALLLRNRIKRHSGKSNVVSIRYVTDTTDIRYRRILLPVWILHYTWGDTPKKVVVCGLHGRTFGERPFSTIKLLGLAALASLASALLGFLWGAFQIF